MRRTRLTAGAVVAGDRHLHALPIIAVYKHVATDLCRATCHSFIADALAIEALTAVGHVASAISRALRAYAGDDLPATALGLPANSSANAAISPPKFAEHLPPTHEVNEGALAAICGAAPGPGLADLVGELAISRLEIARASILTKLAFACPPLMFVL